MVMASLCLKIAANIAGVLLFTAIGLVAFNLWRETEHLRDLNRQILSLCQSSDFEDVVNASEE